MTSTDALRRAWQSRGPFGRDLDPDVLRDGAALAAESSPALLAELLTTFDDPAGRPIHPWIEARYRDAGTHAPALRDLDRLADLAADARDVALTLRCALLQSALRAFNPALLPPALVVALARYGTEAGRWTPDATAAHLDQLPAPLRARCLDALARPDDTCTPPPQADVAALQAILRTYRISDHQRLQALTALAAHTPRDVLSAARELHSEDQRLHVFIALAPHLPRDLLDDAERLRPPLRASLLAALAPHLPADERPALVRRALQAACAIGAPGAHDHLLAALAPHLPHAVLSAALATSDPWRCSLLLPALAPHLPFDVLDATRGLPQTFRGRPLRALAPYLPADLYERARQEALDDLLPIHRSSLLHDLDPLPWSPPALPTLDRLHQQVLHTADPVVRRDALADLEPWLLPEHQRLPHTTQALHAAHHVRHSWLRSPLLGTTAPHLPTDHDLLIALARRLAINPLPELLNDLHALAPWWTHLLTAEELTALLQTLLNISRAWP